MWNVPIELENTQKERKREFADPLRKEIKINCFFYFSKNKLLNSNKKTKDVWATHRKKVGLDGQKSFTHI